MDLMFTFKEVYLWSQDMLGMLQSSKGSGQSFGCRDCLLPFCQGCAQTLLVPVRYGLVLPDSSVGSPTVYLEWGEKNGSVLWPNLKLSSD